MAYNPGPRPTPEDSGRLEEAQARAKREGVEGPAESELVVQSVTAAVERYLAQRGTVSGSATSSGAPGGSAMQGVVAGVVDQYFAKREPRQREAACACSVQAASKGPSGVAAIVAPARVEPPAPQVTIVDFVCEDDVRSAIAQGKKIFIGPRTIVTPSARELAAPGEILVRAER